MEQQATESNSPIGSEEQTALTEIITAMFGDADKPKIDLTFRAMQRNKWTKDEFRIAVHKFVDTWKYGNNWMPANILEINMDKTERIIYD